MKKLFVTILAALMAISMTAGCSLGNSSTGNEVQTVNDGDGISDNGKIYKPQIMYFVSKSDEGYDEEMKMINEVKTEYGDTAEIDVRDVDENPEDKTNFGVDGMTPALIVLNTANNITAMEFKCSDKETVIKNLEDAFNGIKEDIESGKVDAAERTAEASSSGDGE